MSTRSHHTASGRVGPHLKTRPHIPCDPLFCTFAQTLGHVNQPGKACRRLRGTRRCPRPSLHPSAARETRSVFALFVHMHCTWLSRVVVVWRDCADSDGTFPALAENPDLEIRMLLGEGFLGPDASGAASATGVRGDAVTHNIGSAAKSVAHRNGAESRPRHSKRQPVDGINAALKLDTMLMEPLGVMRGGIWLRGFVQYSVYSALQHLVSLSGARRSSSSNRHGACVVSSRARRQDA